MGIPGDLGITIHTKVRGTTVTGGYEVEGDTVVLTSFDFGEASSKLDGAAPQQVAERLLRGLAEAALARPGSPYLTDEEAKGSSPMPKQEF